MSDNVIPIGGITRLDFPADRILEESMGVFESVIILGVDKDGDEAFVSSFADDKEILWLIKRLETVLMQGVEGVYEE